MHVVSVCLHYGNIIRLSWQRPLQGTDLSSAPQNALIWCKNCENRSTTSRDIRPNTPVSGRVVPDVHKWALSILELLDRISRNFHTIYKRHWGRDILFHFWMPEQRKWGVWHFFHKIGCHGNIHWDIGKRVPDRSSAPKPLSFGEKVAKIGPAHPEIIVLNNQHWYCPIQCKSTFVQK